MALNRLALDAGLFRGLSAVEIDALMLRLSGVSVSEGDSKGRGTPQGGVISPLLSKDSTPWVRFFLLNPRAVFTQATSSHTEARSPRFVRVLAAASHPL